MSRTQGFIRGVGFGYAGQLLATLIGLWLTPFLLLRIGQHDYGLWLVATQLMFYLGLLDLGVVALLPRETAFAIGRAGAASDAKELPLIIGESSRMVLWQTPLVAIGAALVWFFLPTQWEVLRQPIAVLLLAFVLTFPLRVFNAVLLGLQDFAFLGKTNIVASILGSAVTVSFVIGGFGLYALAFGWTALQLITAGANWYRLHSHFPGVLPRALPKLRHRVAHTRLRQGFWVSTSQIAQLLLTGTDILIIGKFFGPEAVVPYVCTAKLISVLSNQPQLLMQTAGPALSQIRMGESRDRFSQVSVALGQATLMLSGAVVCVGLVINHGFVVRWVGAEQFGGLLLTGLILLNMLLRHWNVTVGYALFSFGYEKRLCLTALLDGFVTVGAIALFVSFFGLIGAPIGLIIGVSAVSLPLNLKALAAVSGLSLTAQARPLFPWFTRFVVLAIVAVVVAKVWTPSTLPLIAVTAMATGAVYALVMFPIALRGQLGIYLRPRFSQYGVKFFRALRLEDPA